MSFSGQSEIGQVKIFTTDKRGFTADEIADRAVEKIIQVGENVAPEIAKQARLYREEIRKVLVKYLTEAQQSERQTIRANLVREGYKEIALLIGDI